MSKLIQINTKQSCREVRKDSDGLEQVTVGQAMPEQDFIQPLICMGTSQGADAVPFLPGEKHSTS